MGGGPGAHLYVFKGDDAVAAVAREAFLEYFSENALGGKRAFHEHQADGRRDRRHRPRRCSMRRPSPPVTSRPAALKASSRAVKACRNWSRERRGRRDQRFNMVLPETGHPAFTKAGDLMDIEVRRVPVGKDFARGSGRDGRSDRCRHDPDRRLSAVLFLRRGRLHRRTFRDCAASRRLAPRRRLRRRIPCAVRRCARLRRAALGFPGAAACARSRPTCTSSAIARSRRRPCSIGLPISRATKCSSTTCGRTVFTRRRLSWARARAARWPALGPRCTISGVDGYLRITRG